MVKTGSHRRNAFQFSSCDVNNPLCHVLLQEAVYCSDASVLLPSLMRDLFATA